jgi:hypothetical protein
MNRKFRLIAILVIAILIPTATAQAYYAAVSGELRDSATNALWVYGATVEVFNCNTLVTINTATLTAPTSAFNIDVSSVATPTPLCIQVTFAAGPNGTPGNAAKGPYPDRLANSGTLNTGVYFTGTGPTAITLRDLSATPHAETGGLWVGIVFALGLLVSGGWFMRRRAARF